MNLQFDSPTVPVMVPARLITSEVSAEVIGAYAILIWWSEQPLWGDGMAVPAPTVEALAERLSCSLEHAAALTSELAEIGAIQFHKLEPARVPCALEPPPLRLLRAPNEPDGSWSGQWPLQDGDSVPPKRTSVVYSLYGEDGLLLYIGSTGAFLQRMKGHRMKRWAQWRAQPCISRGAAYRLERDLVAQHRPPLNAVINVGVPAGVR